MQKLIVVLFVVAHTVPAFTADTRATFRRAESLPAYSNVVSAAMKCFDAICNDPSDYALTTLQNEARASTVPIFEIAEMAAAGVEAELEDEKAGLAALEKWLPTAPLLTDPVGIRFFNFFSIMNYDPETKQTVDGNVVYDAKATARKYRLTADESERATLVWNEMLSTDEPEVFPTDDVDELNKLMTSEEITRRIEGALADIDNNMNEVLRLPQMGFLKQMLITSTGKYMKEQIRLHGITSKTLSDITSTLKVSRLLQMVIKDPAMNRALLSSPVDLRAHAKKTEMLAINRAELAASVASLEDRKNRARFACASNLRIASVFLPNEADRAAIEAQGEQSKKSFVKMLSTSTPLSETIVSAMSKRRFYTHGTRERHSEQVSAAVSESLADSQSQNRLSREIENGPSRDLYLSMNMAAAPFVKEVKAAPAENEEDDDLDSTTEICTDMQPDIIPDQTRMSGDLIRLGITTARWPVQSEQIAFHEMGHQLQALIMMQGTPAEKAWLGSTLKCLKSMHLRSEKMDYGRDDFADLFAPLSTRGSNSMCYLLKSSGFSEDSLALINPDPSDVHSSTFLRAITVDFRKNRALKPQCTDVMKGRPPLKDCLKEASGTKAPPASPQPGAQ